MLSRVRSRIPWALILGLVLASGGGSLVPAAWAEGESHQLVLPRLMATVIAVEPHGLATIQTGAGAVRQVSRGGGWQVGDRIACEQYEGVSPAVWLTLDCQKAS
jgi:hypothetical protein